MEKTESAKQSMEQEAVKKPIPAILLRHHHDISAFAGKDLTRPVIAGVHYNAARKCVEATNGASVICVPVEENFDHVLGSPSSLPEDCIIPAKLYKKAISSIAKSKLPVLETTQLSANDSVVSFETTDSSVGQKLSAKLSMSSDAFRKNMDQVAKIPGNVPKITVCLSASELKKIADYACKHGNNKQKTAVTFTLDRSSQTVLTVIEFEIGIYGAEKAYGAIMPMRPSH